MATAKDPGRIITFYSYKGGTGRSMALANVAWLLASAGKQVLIVDWDLEAPGLHRYVHPFLDDPDVSSSEGVIDFVISYTEEASGKKPDENLDPDWFAPYADITRFAIPLDYPFPNGGALDFIPAGKQGSLYAGRVNSFNWGDFYLHLGGRAVLEEARARVRDRYDYTLIDSRTGVSDTSGICTVQLPDAVVVCFTLNMQSVSGAAAAAGSMQNQRLSKPLSLFPVAMRVETAEKIKTDRIREFAKERFLNFMSDSAVAPTTLDEYWHEVEVPQIPFYAFEEQLAYFLDPPNQVGGVLASMRRLAWHLTKVDVRNVPGPDPAVRDRIVASYAAVWSAAEQAPQPEPPKRAVYLSFNQYTAPGSDGTIPASIAATLPVPAGTELITSNDLVHTGPWMETFRAILRRSVAIFLILEEHGVTPVQQRELAVALDHQSRLANPSDFRIAAAPLPGAALRPYPGLAFSPGSCPYPGLRPFDTEDCPVFFGREVFLDRIVEQMQTAPVIALGGKPGAGKTSALRAGLIPRLLLQDAPRHVWKTVLCNLAGDALACLAEALSLAQTSALFEGQRRQETADLLARVPKEGPAIFRSLTESILSAWPPADHLAIIIETGASRQDPQYFNLLAREIPGVCFILVSEVPDSSQVSLPELSKADLIRAIEQPALRTGSSLEPGLAARIAADLDGQEDVPALLQFCMQRLWARRQEQTIRTADYEAIGAALGAVAVWAGQILNTLSSPEQQIAMRLMSRLVPVPGDGTRQTRTLRSDAMAAPLSDVAAKLALAGLLIPSPTDVPQVTSYSLFHPSLGLRWPRLQAEAAQNAEFLNWLAAFQSAAQVFAVQQSYSALLRGDALATARKWRTACPDDFTPAEIAFIERSESEAQAAAAGAISWSNVKTGIRAVGLLILVAGAFIYNRYCSTRPEPENLIAAAVQQRTAGDWKDAIAGLTRALTLKPDRKTEARIYSDRAFCYKLAGDWNESIADLTAALAAADSVDRTTALRLLHDRAYAYLQAHRPEEALADYQHILKIDPNDAAATSVAARLTRH